MKSSGKKADKYSGRHAAAGRGIMGSRRLLALCLVLILAACLAVGGTLAYLSASSNTVTNTFQAGNIKYTLTLEPNAKSVGYEDKSVDMPALDKDEANTTELSAAFRADKLPMLTGYTFGGWYYETACENKSTNTSDDLNFTLNYVEPEDENNAPNKVHIILYAKWTANPDTPYTVQHWQQNIGGGEEKNETNYTLVDADTQTLNGTTDTQVTPEVKNYEGFTAPSAQTVTIAGDGSTVVNYYYTRNSYTVTLTAGTGIESVTGAKTYQYDESVSIDAVVKTGYTWNNWTGNYTTTEQNYTFNMPASDVTETANATAHNYKVVFEANGGSDENGKTQTEQSFTYDEEKALSQNEFTRKGYTFSGWNTKADGSGIGYADKENVKNLSSNDRAEIILYAQWTPISYTVKFHANGGDGTMVDQRFTYDVAQNLSRNAFEMSDHEFIGWASSENGGVAYEDQKSVSNLTDIDKGIVNLYAVWQQNTYTLTLHYNNGMSDEYHTVRNGENFVCPTNVTKANAGQNVYFFDGWYTEDGKRVESVVIEKMSKEYDTMHLYAHWKTGEAYQSIIKGSGYGNYVTITSNKPDTDNDGLFDEIHFNIYCTGSSDKLNPH